MYDKPPQIDEIGPWSEEKHIIVRKYMEAYSKILNKQRFYYVYIDAFAGSGVHISESTKEFIPGSPLQALLIEPPFKEYHFIEMDKGKIELLKEMVDGRPNVYIYRGDCNTILLKKVFPTIKYKDYMRGLCLLDPYGIHLEWKVIDAAGKNKAMEMLLNFPVMDMHMNVLFNNPEKVPPEQTERMNKFWGDESWKDAAYTKQPDLFGVETRIKNPIHDVAFAFKKRLKEVAGFEFVADPLPMKNTKGGILYYIFFASHNRTGYNIISDIFKRYQQGAYRRR